MRKIKQIIIFTLTLTAFTSVSKAASFVPANNYFFGFSLSDSTQLEDKKFNLYVNQGYLFIKYTKPQELQNGEVAIYNLLGQEVTRKKLDAISVNQISIPVQNTCYLVRISYSGKIFTQKVIVRSNY